MRLPQVSSKTAVVTGPIVGRRLGEPDAEPAEPIVLGLDVVDRERRERDAVLDERLLERPRRRVPIGLEEELDAVGRVGRDDGQPAGARRSGRRSSSRSRAHRCRSASALAWSSTSTLVTMILMRCLSFGGSGHRSAISRERRGVEVVELVAALAARSATRPAASSTSRCCEIACRVEPRPCFMIRRAQISNRVWPSRSASSSRIVRRVGSASARTDHPRRPH